MFCAVWEGRNAGRLIYAARISAFNYGTKLKKKREKKRERERDRGE